MGIIHTVVGDLAAIPIQQAIEQDQQLSGSCLVLKDILNVGPLYQEGKGLSELRSQFWQRVHPEDHKEIIVDDLERLMQVSSQLSNQDDQVVWFWMASLPADLMAYFWLLHFLRKHQGRFYVINIAGLPFLDEKGKLFYPDSIASVPSKEIIKAKKLARAVGASEWETDGEEWARLRAEGDGVRTFEGGKKLASRPIDYYDAYLLEAMGNEGQKANKIVGEAMKKTRIPTGDTFLHWRLREMASAHILRYDNGYSKFVNP